MLTFIAALAIAAGLAFPHAHATTVLGTHAHAPVTSLDGNGGGPPIVP